MPRNSILSSISCTFSKRLIQDFGGLYHVEIKNGLTLGLLISTHKNSKASSCRSVLTLKQIELRMYIATPPPCRDRSFLTKVYLSIDISESQIVSSSRVSFRTKTSK